MRRLALFAGVLWLAAGCQVHMGPQPRRAPRPPPPGESRQPLPSQQEVIEVKEIHADWVEAEELHAKEVKFGR